MLVYPNIKPDKISNIELPDYISTGKEFRQGDKYFQRTQFVGATTALQLEYSMLLQSELDLILQLWENSEGAKLFTLPSNFYSSYPITFKNSILNLKSTTFWRLSKAPESTPRIVSAYDGVSGRGRNNVYDLQLIITSEIS